VRTRTKSCEHERSVHRKENPCVLLDWNPYTVVSERYSTTDLRPTRYKQHKWKCIVNLPYLIIYDIVDLR
jgi:hypothetical protein